MLAARDLAAGCEWAEQRLGAKLAPGGEHPLFGTHNRLLGLELAWGGRAYLEVIAVQPGAACTRPRWFELDTPQMQTRLERGPALIHWVARRPLLPSLPDWAARLPWLPLQRGSNRWSLTVAPGGELPGGGALPSLIDWETPPPTQTLPVSGVVLEGLDLWLPHPAELAPWAGPGIRLHPAQQVRLQATCRRPDGEQVLL
ncbi:VOC family protein [Deinococcus lacus]|uniref:VOC family protein n=1 Tax=Deinococcus lacus TaxID=392561 RepID=A0ABW1YE97_9DEIO